MKRLVVTAVVALGLSVLAASLPARAQGVGQQIAFDIKFDFTAEGKTVRAGEYVFTGSTHRNGELSLKRTDGKFRMVLTPMTRLARQHQGDAPKASLVFDKVGDQRMLSEIWLPGPDGYLIRAAAGEEEHEVLEVK